MTIKKQMNRIPTEQTFAGSHIRIFFDDAAPGNGLWQIQHILLASTDHLLNPHEKGVDRFDTA